MQEFDLSPYFGHGDCPKLVVASIHNAAKVLGYRVSEKFGLMVHDNSEGMRLDNDQHCGDAILFSGDTDELYHLADIAGTSEFHLNASADN